MHRNTLLISVLLSAGIALTGCQKSYPQTSRQTPCAISTKQQADMIDSHAGMWPRNRAKSPRMLLSDNAEASADAMHDKADAVRKQGEKRPRTRSSDKK